MSSVKIPVESCEEQSEVGSGKASISIPVLPFTENPRFGIVGEGSRQHRPCVLKMLKLSAELACDGVSSALGIRRLLFRYALAVRPATEQLLARTSPFIVPGLRLLSKSFVGSPGKSREDMDR